METVATLFVSSELIDNLMHLGRLPLDRLAEETELDEEIIFPNAQLLLQCGKQSALSIVSSDGQKLLKLDSKLKIEDTDARNKEQLLLMHLLKDDAVKLVTVLGRAGVGKSYIVCAYALERLKAKRFKRIVFAKPTYQVGGGPAFGSLPGEIADKYSPFLQSYLGTMQEILGPRGGDFLEMAVEKGTVEFIPIQFMRGLSFIDTLVVLDEAQSLNLHEMGTVCSRIGQGSKLIVLGDLRQKDRVLDNAHTGLVRIVNSPKVRESSLCAVVELVKNERSGLSGLLDEVLFD